MGQFSLLKGISPWTLAIAIAAVVVLPATSGGQWIKIFTSTACFTLAIAGIAFMYARLGMVNLAQIALMGLGGWVTLRLNHAFALPFELNVLLGGFVTMVFGAVLAIPALRMRGLYLALVTLMAAGALEIVFGTYGFPNGGEGFWGVQTSLADKMRRPALAQSDAAYLRYVLVVVILGFLLIEAHRRTAPGRAWAMIRRSEAAAMAAGVNVTLYKTWAFAISGLLGGIAGGLLAGSLGLLDPGSFRAPESILLFALAVVGGARFWLGAVIGAALYRILPALLNDWGLDADLSFVIFGAGLLHAVITAPDGIAGQILAGLKRKEKDAVQVTHVDTNQMKAEAQGAAQQTTQAAVELNDVSVQFGGVKALQNISARFEQPITGIIGPNGAGKTTLMNVFSGFVTARGTVQIGDLVLTELAPSGRSQAGLRRSFQKEEIANDLSVRDNILVQLDSIGGNKDDLDRAIAFVGLSGMEDIMGAELNAFERRLVDLARCIVGDPKIIMLDEPAGGLSSSETDRLGDLILHLPEVTKAKVLVIDHDVDLIKRICAETLVLDFGQMVAFGPTEEVLNNPKVKAAYLGTAEEVV